MTDLEALYKAICRNPEDETLRLIYADVLDETDDKVNHIRADYIRRSIKNSYPPDTASMKALAEWKEEQKALQDIVYNYVYDWTPHEFHISSSNFMKGFPYKIPATLDKIFTDPDTGTQVTDYARRIVETTPITEFWTGINPEIGETVRWYFIDEIIFPTPRVESPMNPYFLIDDMCQYTQGIIDTHNTHYKCIEYPRSQIQLARQELAQSIGRHVRKIVYENEAPEKR